MNIEYHVYVVSGRLNDALPTGLNRLECSMCCRVNGRGRVTDFYHIAAKATAPTFNAILMVLKYFSMRPTAAAAPNALHPSANTNTISLELPITPSLIVAVAVFITHIPFAEYHIARHHEALGFRSRVVF